jgi:hypothetical protein
LQVADRVHLAQVHPDRDQGLGDLRRQPVMITLAPMSREASTVCTRWFATDSSTSGAPVMSMTTTLARCVRMPVNNCSVSCLARSLSSTPMIGRHQQSLTHRQHRRRQLPDGVLLLADDPFPLVDEADCHGVGDPVRRRLIRVEHSIEQREVALVLLEQRAGEDVTQQQNDADNLMRLNASRNDALDRSRA